MIVMFCGKATRPVVCQPARSRSSTAWAPARRRGRSRRGGAAWLACRHRAWRGPRRFRALRRWRRSGRRCRSAGQCAGGRDPRLAHWRARPFFGRCGLRPRPDLDRFALGKGGYMRVFSVAASCMAWPGPSCCGVIGVHFWPPGELAMLPFLVPDGCGDVGRGDDYADLVRVFRQGPLDQGDRPRPKGSPATPSARCSGPARRCRTLRDRSGPCQNWPTANGSRRSRITAVVLTVC